MGPTVKGKSFPKKMKESYPSSSRSGSIQSRGLQVSKVDWKTEKLTPEQWRFLNRIYSQFAELLSPQLTSSFPVRVIVEFEGIIQEVFREFLGRFDAPVPLAVFPLDEKNKGLMTMDAHLSFTILDLLLGGKGESVERVREFTEVENSLFQQCVARKILEVHSEAWSSISPLNSNLDYIGFSPDSLVLFPYRETILSSSFLLRFGNFSGSLHLAFPVRFIRGTLPRNPEELKSQNSLRKTSGISPSLSPAMVEKRIENTNVTVSVEVGTAELVFQDLIGIEEGDVLCLPASKDNSLPVKVGGKTKFLGKPGILNNKISVQITEIVEEGDENYED